MFEPDQGDYTAIIPTFNRPVLVARLLRYLAGQQADFPVLVLDASDPEVQDQIAELVEATPLRATHRRFPTATGHHASVRAGLEEVDTPFASLLPDDDVVMPAGHHASLEFLRRHPDYIAAQGYYVGFTESGSEMRLTEVQDWCPSIDAERPLQRLFQYAQRYQPMVCGIYRTATLRRTFAATTRLSNIMLQEMLQAFHGIQEGKLARVPAIYSLRRNDGSIIARRRLNIFYQFMDSPERLLGDYVLYRRMMADVFAAGPEGGMQPEALARLIDLIQGQFFHAHYEAGPMSFVLQKELGMLTPEQVAVGDASMLPAPLGESAAVLDRATAGNRPRRYRIDAGVVAEFPSPEVTISLEEVAQTLDDLAVYE